MIHFYQKKNPLVYFFVFQEGARAYFVRCGLVWQVEYSRRVLDLEQNLALLSSAFAGGGTRRVWG